MTDTRLAETFLVNDRVDGLTDGAYRVLVNALVWSVSQGTDGALPRRALRHLHPDGTRTDLVDELVDARFLLATDSGYAIRNYLRYQTAAADVERSKELARERKRRQRSAAQEKAIASVTRDETQDGGRDGTRAGRRGPLGQDRQGQDRTGVTEGERSYHAYEGGLVSWEQGL